MTSKPRSRLPKRLENFFQQQIAKITDEPRFTAYLITNLITQEQYVGITERNLKDRWRQHIRDGHNGTGYSVHKAMNKWGVENFEFQFIACAPSFDDLIELDVS